MLRQFGVCDRCLNLLMRNVKFFEIYIQVCADQTLAGYSYINPLADEKKAKVIRVLERNGFLLTCDSLYSPDMVRVKAKGIFDTDNGVYEFCRNAPSHLLDQD